VCHCAATLLLECKVCASWHARVTIGNGGTVPCIHTVIVGGRDW
jgi:hypothetical protein